MVGIPTDIDFAEYFVSFRDAGIIRHINSLSPESRDSNFNNAISEHFTH